MTSPHNRRQQTPPFRLDYMTGHWRGTAAVDSGATSNAHTLWPVK